MGVQGAAGGGLGAGYILWEFKAHDLPSLVLEFRNNWQYPDRWARKVCQRLNVPAKMLETGSARKAEAELRDESRVEERRAERDDELELPVRKRLGLDAVHSAYGVSEMVDENMANAARVHAIERGKTLADRTLIAFGGAAPLHAARLAEKLGMDRVVIPASAGVGSAVGFLRAPVAYEVVRSRFFRLGAFDPATVNAMLREMRDEAHAVVASGAPGAPIDERRHVEMRYIGQGHEIPVALPARNLAETDAIELRELFEARYAEIFGRAVPGVEVEILAWSIVMSASAGDARSDPPMTEPSRPETQEKRRLFEGLLSEFQDVPVHWRDDLAPGSRIAGPAIIAEAQTATVVGALFDAAIDRFGNIVLERRTAGASA